MLVWQVVSREEEMAWLELRLEYSGPHNPPTFPGTPSSPASSSYTPSSTSNLGRRSTVPIQLRLLPSLQVLLLQLALHCASNNRLAGAGLTDEWLQEHMGPTLCCPPLKGATQHKEGRQDYQIYLNRGLQ